MPQISSNFILRSKLPNFERDSFKSLEEMYTVQSSWMDEGHISYCQETGKHYIFRSENNTLTGADRWTQLDVPITIQPDQSIISVSKLSDLIDELAKSLKTGSMVYVIEDNAFFYNVYDQSKDIQTVDYLEGYSGWFKPLLESFDLTAYTTKEYIEEQGFLKEHQNISHLATKESLDSYTTKEYIEEQGFLKEHQDISHLATIDSLNEYAKLSDIPAMSDDVVKKDDLNDYAKQNDIDALGSQMATISAATGSIQSNLDGYKEEVDVVYAKKNELTDYVKYSEFQNNTSTTIKRIVDVEQDINGLKDQMGIIDDTYVQKTEFDTYKEEIEAYKEEVEATYAKPSDIASQLNTYAPSKDNANRWIGAECSGELLGQTGSEIANNAYSYSAVLDKMLFSAYNPEITSPSVEVDIKPTWNGGNEWYDEEKRIILVKAGSIGPDGTDFVARNIQDAMISYPKGIELSNNFTNGLIPASDDRQSTVGFCKVKNENGEWEYYKKENNIYHVPSVLNEGEYRYYIAAYFQKGSPAINNYNLTIAEWNENVAVESNDYITIIASKPTYYNTKDGFVENKLKVWRDEIIDYMILAPTCQTPQAFKLPRKIKGLYIWNDISGYAQVPMVYQKDKNGLLTDSLIPAYFTESIDENNYYTYIYDSSNNGHRGEVKIKVIF